MDTKPINPNLYLYLLVRTDLLSMKFGKAVAQAAHAANQFTDEHVIRPLLNGDTPSEDVMEWRTHANGFGTTISLDVASDGDLKGVIAAAQALGFPAGETVDPSYPYIVNKEIFRLLPKEIHTEEPVRLHDGTYVCFRNEVTTGYIFGDKPKLEVILKRFKLLNND